MWNESEMSDAFGRRIARDMPKMPRGMVACFYASEFLFRLGLWAGVFLLLVGLGLAFLVFYQSYFGVGETLISENQFTPSIFWVFGAAIVVRWAIPVLFNAVISTWYYRRRNHWS